MRTSHGVGVPVFPAGEILVEGLLPKGHVAQRRRLDKRLRRVREVVEQLS